ncbi:dystrophin-like isoform X3 [Octopus sinensis]|uniref:Dystrophin-like isoform X3 n=1 Tax=Octopus sinensis TaxID=2607531 RepID=A0A7E6F0Q8_9MOLL|nr:dystrophin-like isoform X3 [Octopus sinensis]
MSPDNSIQASKPVVKETKTMMIHTVSLQERFADYISQERMTNGWEKMETSNRIPYYLSCMTERTSWDHPLYSKIMEELSEFNNIRFAAYRTAMKLRYLQQKLNLDLVPIDKVRSVFKQHGCPQGEDPLLNCHDLNEILRDLFADCQHPRLDKTTNIRSSDLIQNFILNLYDRQRRGVVHALSVKTALAAMCGGQLGEKYKYFYEEISDPSTFIDCSVLSSFLVALMRIPDLIHEGMAYGGLNSTPALESCLQMSDCKYGISEDMFYAWLYKEPQTLVWLPTLHRIVTTESVKHEVKCSICKDFPIIGFRYRCLKCFKFDICQQCFFNGKTKGKHKLKHPLKEFCAVASTKQDMKAFLITVRNNLSKKHRYKRRVKYLPVDNCNSSIGGGSDTMSTASTRRSTMYEEQVSRLTTSHASDSASSAPARLCEMEHPTRAKQTCSKSLQTDNLMVSVSVHNKENRTPSPTETVALQQVQELQKIIRDLESENRNLYRQLAEIRDNGTDSCSSLSYGDDIEMEKELVEAKKEVVDDHNLRLNKQLNRVHVMLKNNAATEKYQNPVVTNGTNHNNSPLKNGYHLKNGYNFPNGFHIPQNGFKPQTIPPFTNGYKSYNGLQTQNGYKLPNGFLHQTNPQNGFPIQNGFQTSNNYQFHNDHSSQGGFSLQNGSELPALLKEPPPYSNMTSVPEIDINFDQSTLDSTHKFDVSSPCSSIISPSEAEEEMDKLVKKLRAFPQNHSYSDKDGDSISSSSCSYFSAEKDFSYSNEMSPYLKSVFRIDL